MKKTQTKTKKKAVKKIDCPICGEEISPSKLKSHLLDDYQIAEESYYSAEQDMWEISELFSKKFKKNIEDLR